MKEVPHLTGGACRRSRRAAGCSYTDRVCLILPAFTMHTSQKRRLSLSPSRRRVATEPAVTTTSASSTRRVASLTLTALPCKRPDSPQLLQLRPCVARAGSHQDIGPRHLLPSCCREPQQAAIGAGEFGRPLKVDCTPGDLRTALRPTDGERLRCGYRRAIVHDEATMWSPGDRKARAVGSMPAWPLADVRWGQSHGGRTRRQPDLAPIRWSRLGPLAERLSAQRRGSSRAARESSKNSDDALLEAPALRWHRSAGQAAAATGPG